MQEYVCVQIFRYGRSRKSLCAATSYFVPSEVRLQDGFLDALCACTATSQLKTVAAVRDGLCALQAEDVIIVNETAKETVKASCNLYVSCKYTAFLLDDEEDIQAAGFTLSSDFNNKELMVFISDARFSQTDAELLSEISAQARFRRTEALVFLSARPLLQWDAAAAAPPSSFVEMYPALRDVLVLTPTCIDPDFFKLPVGRKWRTVVTVLGLDADFFVPRMPGGTRIETLVLTTPSNADAADIAWRAVWKRNLQRLAAAADRVLVASSDIVGELPAEVARVDAAPLRRQREDQKRPALVWWGGYEMRAEGGEVLLPNGRRVPELPHDMLNMFGRLLHNGGTS